MIPAQALYDHTLADERPDLHHPLEQAAIVGSYLTRTARCRKCDRPLTEREHAPDYDDHGNGNDGTCRECASLGAGR